VRLALLLALLVGCTPALTKPIAFTPVERFEPAPLWDVVGEPTPLLAGMAMDEAGHWFSREQIAALKAYIAREQGALGDCYAQGTDDRRYAEVKDDAMIGLVGRLRRQIVEAYAMGVATGFGGCGAIGGAVFIGVQ